MERGEAKAYRALLHEQLKSTTDPRERMDFLRYARSTKEYREAHASPGRLFLQPRREATLFPGEPVVIAEIEKAPLTKTQIDIQWANDAVNRWEDFVTQPDPQKNERRQRRAERGNLLSSLTVGLVDDPERLVTAMNVWKARQEGSLDLFPEARTRLLQESQHHWESFTPEHLAHLLIIYSKDKEANAICGDVLRAYFRGPDSQKGRVDAYYNFSVGSLDVVDDVVAFREAARIGRFDTEILPRGSVFHRDIYLANIFGFEDPIQRSRAHVVTQVFNGESMLDSDEHDAITARNVDAVKEMSTRYASALRSAYVRSEKVKGVETMDKYLDIMLAMQESGLDLPTFYELGTSGVLDDLPMDSFVRTLMNHHLFDMSDPLWLKYKKKVEPKIFPHLHKKTIIERDAKESYSYVTIHFPDKPYILEMALPQSIAARKRDVLRFIREGDVAERVDAHFAEHTPEDDIMASKMFTHERTFEGHSVHAIYREPVESETRKHPFEFVAEVGFPAVNSEDIAEENNELARKISTSQTRFLNPRGFSVPMTHPSLTDLGYKRMEFRKDTEDPEKTKVTVVIDGFPGEMKAHVKLDKYWDFDFEGLTCDISPIRDSLRNVMLTFLYPVLCEPTVHDERGREVDIEHLFVDRVGYLGFLREGYDFRQPQADALLIKEGKDLAVVSEQRKIDGETRNSTYYKPKITEDPTTPPVKITIPLPADKFSREISDEGFTPS